MNEIYSLYDKKYDTCNDRIFRRINKWFNVSLIEDPYQENDINSFINLKTNLRIMLKLLVMT